MISNNRISNLFEKQKQVWGWITAIEANLSPVLVSSPESDVLVVLINVRIFNVYGPQEHPWFSAECWKGKHKSKKWKLLCLIQCDANAKLGIPNNGQVLSDILNRHKYCVLNSGVSCKGTITRLRKTKKYEDKSVLDYIIVCGKDACSNKVFFNKGNTD